jgi:hypothetical protein
MDKNTLMSIKEKLAYEAGRDDGIQYVLDLALSYCNNVGDPYIHMTLMGIVNESSKGD